MFLTIDAKKGETRLGKATVLLVPGGGIATSARVDRAVTHFRELRLKEDSVFVVASGGVYDPALDPKMTEAEWIWQRLGPDIPTLLEERAFVTPDNLQFSTDLLRDAKIGWGRIVVVSQPLHCRRFQLTAGALGLADQIGYEEVGTPKENRLYEVVGYLIQKYDPLGKGRIFDAIRRRRQRQFGQPRLA